MDGPASGSSALTSPSASDFISADFLKWHHVLNTLATVPSVRSYLKLDGRLILLTLPGTNSALRMKLDRCILIPSSDRFGKRINEGTGRPISGFEEEVEVHGLLPDMARRGWSMDSWRVR